MRVSVSVATRRVNSNAFRYRDQDDRNSVLHRVRLRRGPLRAMIQTYRLFFAALNARSELLKFFDAEQIMRFELPVLAGSALLLVPGALPQRLGPDAPAPD